MEANFFVLLQITIQLNIAFLRKRNFIDNWGGGGGGGIHSSWTIPLLLFKVAIAYCFACTKQLGHSIWEILKYLNMLKVN